VCFAYLFAISVMLISAYHDQLVYSLLVFDFFLVLLSLILTLVGVPLTYTLLSVMLTLSSLLSKDCKLS